MLSITYRDLDTLLQWLATIFTLAGAVLTSAAVDPYNVWCMNVGSLLFLIWAIRIRSTSLITVNAGLLVIYAGGTVRSLLVG